jgi:hypothetical protein
MMNKNEYRTWMILLDNPDKWLDVMEMAFLANLTRRQMTSILNAHMDDPHLDKTFNRECRMLVVRLHGPSTELETLRQDINTRFYGVTPAMKQATETYLSLAGWLSIPDIARDSGLDRNDIAHALMAMPDVEVKKTNAGTFYRRTG